MKLSFYLIFLEVKLSDSVAAPIFSNPLDNATLGRSPVIFPLRRIFPEFLRSGQAKPHFFAQGDNVLRRGQSWEGTLGPWDRGTMDHGPARQLVSFQDFQLGQLGQLFAHIFFRQESHRSYRQRAGVARTWGGLWTLDRRS